MKQLILSTLLFLALIMSSCTPKLYQSAGVNYQNYPKREFRGVWMHTVGNGVFRNQTPAEMQSYLRQQLDVYQQSGINAVIFQVRPQADAFYKSDLEPWSKYLTGKQGVAPSPLWDPLEFMVEECHKRNMELHAWLNPYRVATTRNETFSSDHIYYKHPEYFIKYGTQIYFQPGEPWSRSFICKVVKDIVTRYDVDAIHMDDYFYPYPVAGEAFPDKECFQKYGIVQGFSKDRIEDWRRNNVNLLIEQLSYAIKSEKPWVKFGISPFGIYRNKKNTPDGSGSETNGLTNYHDLYADVLLWVQKGWIDYNIPQVYWEAGHAKADYTTLVKWWSKNNENKTLYIGQDISRTTKVEDPVYDGMNQLTRKMNEVRKNDRIAGNCFWSGEMMQNNMGGILDSLENHYHRYPAFVPVIREMDDKAPSAVKKLKAVWAKEGYLLRWKADNQKNQMNRQTNYCVYRFKEGEKIDLDNPSKIVSVTTDNQYALPFKDGKKKYNYVVTALDRLHNESKGVLIKVKL